MRAESARLTPPGGGDPPPLREFPHLSEVHSAKLGIMGCCLVVLVLMFPRVVLLVLFLFSTYLERAYHGLVIPLLGFLFLPLTTLAYAWMTNTHMRIEGVNLLILVVAAVVDAGGLGGGEYHRRRR
jgi:hypothetical protein